MPSKREVRHQPAVDPHYAYLGLHQAALSGNVGLVQYALSEGQPVDAVWDGISALHAAAAGGSEHVARLLIDSGADVNFGRQPKNERDVKARTASSSSMSPPLDKSDMLGPPHAAESLLNPGSTPLHFACAHNNAAVARLLLAHGAAPHIPDKRGVTPLDLLPPASASSPIPTPTSPSSDLLRTVIREYYENEKAKEKEFQKSQIRFYGKAAAVLGFPRSDDDNKRVVGGRHSIEHLSRSPKQAQVQLTSPKHVPVPIPTASPARRGIPNIASPPPSPRRLQPTSPSDRDRTIPSPPPPPSAGYTFGSATVAPTTANPAGWTSTSVSTSVPFIPSDQRRPSLPHIFETPTPSSHSTQAPASTSPSCSRPRSADGTDAPQVFGNGAPSSSSSSPRIAPHSTLPTLSSSSAAVPLGNTRPRTKRSLLSLFKRFDVPCDTKGDVAERDATRGRPSFSSGIGMGLGLGMSSLSPTRHQREHREEIHTAPAEQTTFASSARVRVPEDVFCDDDVFEDYGVPLRQMMDDSEPIVPPVLMPDPDPDPDLDPAFARGQREQNGDADVNAEEKQDEEYSSDDDGEDTVEERTSTDTKRAHPIPIPARHTHAEGTSLGLRLGGSSVGSDTPSPPSAPPLPPSLLTPPPAFPPTSAAPLSPAARSSPRPRPGILRGDFSAVRRSGSRGALRFEGTSLRESGSRGSLRERGGGGGPVLREKASGSSLSGQGSLGVAIGGGSGGDSRLRGDSLSSAVSHASYDTSMASASTTASIPSLDPDTARGSYSSDDEDEDDEPEMPVPELGLDIRTVSNHAQAEALVQKAAKEILELSAFSEGSNLSAQLAAYGETLQLERRFARGEVRRVTSPTTRGEVRRVMSPTRARFGDGVEQGGGGGGEEEEEQGEVMRKKTQERVMVGQKSMERYARGVSKERRSTEGAKEGERMETGCALERTTSLEKEVGIEETKKPKKPRSPKLRRPHTSDSVASAASGTTAPPRFGYSSKQSSGTFLRSSPGEQGRRHHHHVSQSTSVHFPPRSESLDYGTRMVAISPEMEDGVEGGVPHAKHATMSSGSNRSPFGQSSGHSQSPLIPVTGSPFMASTGTVDEFGTSGRPLKQRLGGGLRSLFGKNK